MGTEPQEELDADIAGQKLKIKTASLNTIATVATLVVVCLIAYVLFEHRMDAKAGGLAMTDAVLNMVKAQQDTTRAHRETNCLMGIPEAQRESKADWCKRISQ